VRINRRRHRHEVNSVASLKCTVDFGEGDAIEAFHEKAGSIGCGWINAGIYLISTRQITSFPAGVKYSLEREFFPSLIGKGLFGFKACGRFIDIGTPESYTVAGTFFSQRDI